MKKYILILAFTLGIIFTIYGQDKYFTRTGTLSFYSETPIENIEAENNQASAILDIESGEIAVSAQMVGFEFEKALMQEHFNENYVESDKYPKATFKGKILNYTGAPDDSDIVEVTVEGVLSLHGVSKDISTTGTIRKDGETIEAKTTFPVTVSDFDIKIPKAVINNIAKVVEVRVDLTLNPYNQ